ncbi:MAG: SUF system NifU family Fe-S cluster assembly protein [Verrucomicrobia bacterium]|nr:SUF system NifU family Fe-S cluster assembly protein [Verrucomicrobiota bacterium]MBV9274505.1 SUF system NifU family Fe-S cluster assembly protein [Verrucomicrobiota bacterium]
MDFDELYQEIILDHYKRPRNCGVLPPPATRGSGFNPACGDEVTVFVQQSPEGKIQSVSFQAQACAICTASTSLMTLQLKGITREEALALQRKFIDFLTKEGPGDGLGNLRALGGVRKFPQRLKCATLGWHALEAALNG